jgi:hypothetical protein
VRNHTLQKPFGSGNRVVVVGGRPSSGNIQRNYDRIKHTLGIFMFRTEMNGRHLLRRMLVVDSQL